MEDNKDILKHIKPKNREEIDDSYFDNLTSSIIASSNISHPKIVKPIFKRKIFWISSVAALAIVLVSIKSIYINDSINSNFNSISKTELLSYVNNNIEDFDHEMFKEYICEDPTDTLKQISSKVQEIIPTPSNENIEVMFEELNDEDILKYFEKNSLELEEIEDEESI